MRSFTIALLLLVMLLGIVCCNFQFINETSDALLNRANALPAIDSENALPQALALAEYWEARVNLVSLSVCYPAVDRVSEQIALLISCADRDDVYGYYTAIALLRDAAADLRRLERFSIGNLL